jgi:hypothetical protein
VPDVSRTLLLVAGAAGALAGLLVSRRRRSTSGGAPPDPRAEELRRKLAQAREAAVDEADFEAAGMGAETVVEAAPAPTVAPLEDVDEARRRIHEEARSSAEEMRRSGGPAEA